MLYFIMSFDVTSKINKLIKIFIVHLMHIGVQIEVLLAHYSHLLDKYLPMYASPDNLLVLNGNSQINIIPFFSDFATQLSTQSLRARILILVSKLRLQLQAMPTLLDSA